MPILELAQCSISCPVLMPHTFHIGKTHTADTPTTTMNTPFFAPVLPLNLNDEQIAQLDSICLSVTMQFFQKDYAHKIIDTLKHCRAYKKGYFKTVADFRHFNGIYHWVKSHTQLSDYVVFRKYLQVLSGVYRWHFATYQSVTPYNNIHERIKLEVECEHCGSMGKVLIDRLIEANLWAV